MTNQEDNFSLLSEQAVRIKELENSVSELQHNLDIVATNNTALVNYVQRMTHDMQILEQRFRKWPYLSEPTETQK